MKGIGNAKTLIQSDIFWLLATIYYQYSIYMVQQDPLFLTTRQSERSKHLFPIKKLMQIPLSHFRRIKCFTQNTQVMLYNLFQHVDNLFTIFNLNSYILIYWYCVPASNGVKINAKKFPEKSIVQFKQFMMCRVIQFINLYSS